MDPEAFRTLRALFDEAMQEPPEARMQWISSRADLDAATVAELRRLLLREAGNDALPEGLPVSLLAAALKVEASPDAPIPACVGRFVLAEEIGRGGMGCVYRGVREDGGVRQEAAVKILRTDLRQRRALERFLVERELLARLDHPGIARLLDSGETGDGTPFVAMELVRGLGLIEYCASRHLGVVERVILFRQVVAAVSHAHKALVVHRDIKPSNVMVDGEGRVRLLDFGIAKPLANDVAATATADRFFTPAYAPPEQLIGAPITVACDVYSLGALLYELLCGRPPFELKDKRAAEIERLILVTPPRPMAQAFSSLDESRRLELAGRDVRPWRRQLSGELESIVQRALRKEPDSRYASADAMDEDLVNWLEHRPVRAAGAGRLYRLRKFLRRNAIATAAVVIVAASIGVAFALVLRETIAANRERDRAREALSVLGEAFVSADPTGLSGGDISARNILDAASRRISEHVDGKPDVYAELAEKVADVQLALGVVDVDDTGVMRALEWAGREAGQENLAWRLSLLQARRLVARHAFPDAEAALLRLERQKPGDPLVLLARGKFWVARGEPAEAIPFLTRAVAALPRETDDIERIDAHWQLAEAQRQKPDPAAAMSTLQSLLGGLEPVVGANHATVLLTRLRSVNVLLDLKRVDEAISEAQTVSPRIESLYGRTSSVSAQAWSTLALALVRAQRYGESLEPYRKAAQSFAESLGENHVATARSYFNLALMQNYVDPSDPSSAEGFRKAIAGASIARNPADPLVTFFRI